MRINLIIILLIFNSCLSTKRVVKSEFYNNATAINFDCIRKNLSDVVEKNLDTLIAESRNGSFLVKFNVDQEGAIKNIVFSESNNKTILMQLIEDALQSLSCSIKPHALQTNYVLPVKYDYIFYKNISGKLENIIKNLPKVDLHELQNSGSIKQDLFSNFYGANLDSGMECILLPWLEFLGIAHKGY